MKIDLLAGENAMARLHELGRLPFDAVGNGASVGFTLPLAHGEVEGYWQKVGRRRGRRTPAVLCRP